MPCPVLHQNSCQWLETGDNHFMFVYGEYCVRLVANTTHGTASRVWSVPVRKIGILLSTWYCSLFPVFHFQFVVRIILRLLFFLVLFIRILEFYFN